MSKKKKLKAAKEKQKAAAPLIHDRRATDLTRKAKVAPVEVDDPWAENPGDKIMVMRSLRDDPLARLQDRQQIDGAQFAAGRFWQSAYEAVELGGARSLDPGKEAVDGGVLHDPITDRQSRGVGYLTAAKNALRAEEEMLIRDVLAGGLFIEQVAENREGVLPSKRTVERYGAAFRAALDKLAVVYGFATRPPDIDRRGAKC